VLKFYLVENKMKSNQKSPYLPKTIREGQVEYNQLIDMISSNSTVKRADAIAVLSNLEEIVRRKLSDGYSVNLGFLTLRPELRGNFSEYSERYSKKKHYVDVSFQLQEKFKRSLEDSTVRRVTNRTPGPLIYTIKSFHQSEPNSFKANSLLTLRGRHLKFNPSNNDEGLFFESSTNPQNIYRVDEFSRIKPSEVGFKIPDLPPDTYKLQVRARFGEDLRSSSYSELIHITSEI
jgi:predicted histone-like DNA-binding protein